MKKKEKIGPGYRFGRLEVLGPSGQYKNRSIVWICRCECGREIWMDTRWIRRETKLDCGCQHALKGSQANLYNQTFGHLSPMTPTPYTHKGSILWICRCACGSYIEASASQLLSGRMKSCGCHKEKPSKDLRGQIFGQLQVVVYAGKKKGRALWQCRCSCGQEVMVLQSSLLAGKTRSCGCLRKRKLVEQMELEDGSSLRQLRSVQKGWLHPANQSGYTGVYYNRKTGKWIAQITLQKKRRYLGSFSSLQQAIQARRQGEKLHAEFLESHSFVPTGKEAETEMEETDTRETCGKVEKPAACEPSEDQKEKPFEDGLRQKQLLAHLHHDQNQGNGADNSPDDPL